MNICDKHYISKMYEKINFKDRNKDNDVANMYYMTCILQKLIDCSDEERAWFDRHYTIDADFNLHSYAGNTRIRFCSKGIFIYDSNKINPKAESTIRW